MGNKKIINTITMWNNDLKLNTVKPVLRSHL